MGLLFISSNQQVLANIDSLRSLMYCNIDLATDFFHGLHEFFDRHPSIVFIQDEQQGVAGENLARQIRNLQGGEDVKLVLLTDNHSPVIITDVFDETIDTNLPFEEFHSRILSLVPPVPGGEHDSSAGKEHGWEFPHDLFGNVAGTAGHPSLREADDNAVAGQKPDVSVSAVNLLAPLQELSDLPVANTLPGCGDGEHAGFRIKEESDQIHDESWLQGNGVDAGMSLVGNDDREQDSFVVTYSPSTGDRDPFELMVQDNASGCSHEVEEFSFGDDEFIREQVQETRPEHVSVNDVANGNGRTDREDFSASAQPHAAELSGIVSYADSPGPILPVMDESYTLSSGADLPATEAEGWILPDGSITSEYESSESRGSLPCHSLPPFAGVAVSRAGRKQSFKEPGGSLRFRLASWGDSHFMAKGVNVATILLLVVAAALVIRHWHVRSDALKLPAPTREFPVQASNPPPVPTAPAVQALPRFIPRVRPESGYAAAHPGWERFESNSLDYLVYRENGQIKAIQVIATEKGEIPGHYLESAIGEVSGSDHYTEAASQVRKGYRVESGVLANRGELAVYRKIPGGDIRGFVITFP